MPTTLKTMAPTGITAVKAFTPNTDTLATNGDAATVTYGVNNTSLLTVVWSNLANGVYDCVYFAGAIPVASDTITVSGVTTTAETPASASDITAATSPLATATNLATVAGYVDTEIATIISLANAIKAKSDLLPAAPAAVSDIPTVTQIWTAALTEAYRATGATGTGAQLLYEILQNLTNFTNIAGVRTIRRLNGTNVKTYTFDSAATPTALTETT